LVGATSRNPSNHVTSLFRLLAFEADIKDQPNHMTDNVASVVIPTLNRHHLLRRRLPLIAAAGFDEVIVVDSTRAEKETQATRQLCERLQARYVNIPAGRSEARNIGASIAHGRWVFFCDDDGYVITYIDRQHVSDLGDKFDFLTFPGHLAWIFRRSFFIELGGYNENLIAGEDDDLTRRARSIGRETSATGFVEGRLVPLDEQERAKDQWRRLRNQVEYGMTMAAFAREHPSPKSVVLATFRTALGFLHPENQDRVVVRVSMVFLLIVGIMVSPFYLAWYLRTRPTAPHSQVLFPDQRG